MTFTSLAFDTLTPGAIRPEELAVNTLHLAELGPPVVNADRPESFGEPNYDASVLWSAIATAVQADLPDLLSVTILTSGTDTTSGPVRAFAFSGHDSITALDLTNDHDHVQAWCSALTARMGDIQAMIGLQRNGRSASRMIQAELLATDPAAWLIARVPNTWTARAQSGQKQQILDRAAETARPAGPFDIAELTSLWNELVELKGQATNPGATDEQIASFAATTGFELPAGLAALLKLSNGAPEAFGFRSLMSIEEITRQWVEWKKIFDDFMIDDLQQSYQSDQDRTVALYTTPKWVSFLEERTGNYAAVDLLPGPAGQQGQIIYFGADIYTVLWVAADITDFVRREITHLRSDADPNAAWF